MTALPCLLCGRRAAFVALFIPTPRLRQMWGEPPGKVRIVKYSLCKRCQRKPTCTARVEAKIFSEVAAIAATN